MILNKNAPKSSYQKVFPLYNGIDYMDKNV